MAPELKASGFVPIVPPVNATGVELELPETSSPGVPVSFRVVGKMYSVVGWPNFATGFAYIDGPMSELTLSYVYAGEKRSFRLKRREVVYGYIKPPSVSSIVVAYAIENLRPGTYVFAGLAGYAEGDVFYYDARTDKRLVVSGAEPVVSAEPTLPLMIAVLGIMYLARRRG